MKKIALAAALSVAATSAFAGGVPEQPEPEVKGNTSSSAGGYLVPLLLLVALAVAASKQ